MNIIVVRVTQLVRIVFYQLDSFAMFSFDLIFIRTSLHVNVVAYQTVISYSTYRNSVDSTAIILELQIGTECQWFFRNEADFYSDSTFSHSYIFAIWIADFQLASLDFLSDAIQVQVFIAIIDNSQRTFRLNIAWN